MEEGEILIGAAMEEKVGTLGLGRGADVLVALCMRADNSNKDSFTAVDSNEGRRLMPALQRITIEVVRKALGRNIRISDGELQVSPFITQPAVVAA